MTVFQGSAGPGEQAPSYDGLTAAELDALLDARGIDRPKRLTKAQRVALLEQDDCKEG